MIFLYVFAYIIYGVAIMIGLPLWLLLDFIVRCFQEPRR